MQNSDEEIIQEVLAGHVDRYAEIVDRYQQIAANLCYRLVGDRLDVEEVTQRVFVELYLALPRFRFESKLSTYIYRITVNTVAKMLKHDQRIVREDEDRPTEVPTNDTNPEHTVIRDETRRQVRRCITRLKHEQRVALVLYTYKDCSYQEIADIMKVSLSKVETLIFRARKNIQKMLTNHEKTDAE